jgi:predicted 3-demethylubiquinone-9 3-methyltransferase (glyoxalase superfamily)
MTLVEGAINGFRSKIVLEPDGKAFSVSFELDGQEFMGLNAGPEFKFNESVSMFVNCENQAEVDELWSKLTADEGEEVCADGLRISMACLSRLSRSNWVS